MAKNHNNIDRFNEALESGEVKRLFKSGISAVALSEMYQVSNGTVYKKCRAAGVSRPLYKRGKYLDELIEEYLKSVDDTKMAVFHGPWVGKKTPRYYHAR